MKNFIYPLKADAILRLLFGLTSRNHPSRIAGKLADLPLPRPILQGAIYAYCRAFNVDMSEVDVPPSGFRTFNDFFTRRLRPGARPVAEGEGVIVSPCDGTITAVGYVQAGRAIQAKGYDYPVEALLGDASLAEELEGGPYATIYLSPRDYHRVHFPCDGLVEEVRYMPGRLYTVAPKAAQVIEGLFPKNERVTIVVGTPFGRLAISMVGAAMVGRITLSFCGLATNVGQKATWIRLDPKVPVRKGDDLGTFNLGSTVVLFLPKGLWEALAAREGSLVKMGQALFTLRSD